MHGSLDFKAIHMHLFFYVFFGRIKNHETYKFSNTVGEVRARVL